MKSGRVLIVDALNLAFRFMHKRKLGFTEEYRNTIYSIAKSYKCKRIILASDKGSSSYRLALLPTYKANRKEKRTEQSEEDKAFFSEFFTEFNLALVSMANEMEVFVYDGVEADDIAAHLVKYGEELGLFEFWLLSSDKDWDLLVGKNVSRFSYLTRKEITCQNWGNHYDVPRNRFLDYKILLGDSSDNVPGIRGIGPKRASSLIAEFGSVETIYKSLPINRKAVYIQNLNNNAEILPLNEKLFNLLGYCDEALGANSEDINDRIRAR